MFVRIANPIYDTIIKYLLEDIPLAIELLSLILRMQVIGLEVLTQEINVESPKDSKDKKKPSKTKKKEPESENPRTVLRLDFKATIQLPNGKTKVVLLEVQKTKRSSVILRFRKYLGMNYFADYKLQKEAPELYCVYLVGFPLGPSGTPPIVYNPRNLVNGLTGELLILKEELTFVNGLTHESCFVYVNGFDPNEGSLISKVFDLFNQKRKIEDGHFLLIPVPEENTLMSRIARRLEAAAGEKHLLDSMHIEDCYEMDLAEADDKVEEANARTEEERRQKEEERRQKEEARQQLAVSAKKLKAFGMKTTEIGEMLRLSDDEVEDLLK
jgi:hypothetical protein